MELSGKIAVVTGGGSGIGAATCRSMARAGARVVAVDRNSEGAAEVADEIGGLSITADIGYQGEVDEMVARVVADLGPIDIMFNNAGIATGGDPIETPIDDWQEQWEINVMSHVYAVRAVLPGMLERGSGYLLHTASMAGILTSQGNCTYAVTKHAVVGLAEWLAVTYHDRGVRTSLLAPLGVRTPMLGDPDDNALGSALGPVKEASEVGDMVVSAIEEERFLILTDEIAQTWMERKTNDIERWLTGMRRLEAQLAANR